MNVGCCAVALDSVTAVPAVCAHVVRRACDRRPARTRRVERDRRRAGAPSGPDPALATGDAKSLTRDRDLGARGDATAGFGFCVSVTVTVNFSVVPAFGAVNVGCAAVASDSVTAVPAVCVHE